MSTPTLPPDTHSYQDAVTTGFYGRYVDDVPGDYYTVGGEGGGGGVGFSLKSVTPSAIPADAATLTPVTYTGTGFDVNTASAVVSTPDGTGSVAGSVTVVSETEATAQIQGCGEAGAAETWLETGMGEETNHLPVTWEAPQRNFADFTPKSVSLAAAAAGFDLTCTGLFPDAGTDLKLMIAQPSMGGTTIESASVTVNSPTEVVAHFANAATMAEGDAQVYMWVVSEDTAYPGSAFVTFAA